MASSSRTFWWTLWLAALVVHRPTVGSVDEFQCACGYHAAKQVARIETTILAGGDAVDLIAGYGQLVSRMLLVAYSRPEPTARWLWLLNLYANTARQQMPMALLLDGLKYVRSELDEYTKICRARNFATGYGWSRDAFEKYVLENVTSIVQSTADAKHAVRETDFEPRLLYLNDVPAVSGRLSDLLTEHVGVDWTNTADQLSRVYELSRDKWMSGTRELVLYQKKFVSTVAASLMGYVLVHVNRCQRHWASRIKGRATVIGAAATAAASTSATTTISAATAAAAVVDDVNLVGEYERLWMSVGGLLDKFKAYLALGSEKYFKTLVDIAGNPVWDDFEFRRMTRAIETNIVDVGGGLFGVRTVRDTDDATLAAVEAATAAGEEEQPLVELVALVDSNMSAAETYLERVQGLLPGVNFQVVNDFMRSTHIWLT